jgi:tetratricopeptide (TPR) repeat protein
MPTLSAYKIQYNSIGDPTGEFYFQAHNEFLQVWVELGTLALFVVSIGVIALLVWGVQQVRNSRNAAGGMEQVECMGLLASLTAVLYVALFSFSFHVSSTAVPAILMAAALTGGRRNGLENASLGNTPVQPGKSKGGNQLVGRIFLMGVVLVTVVYTLREVTKPFRASRIENSGDAFLLQARGKNHLPHIQERLYWEAAGWYQQALKIHPQSATALNSLGAAFFGLKRYREATQAFERALAVLPTGECYLNLGSAYYGSGEPEKAREAWEKGRNVKGIPEFDKMLKLLEKQ